MKRQPLFNKINRELLKKDLLNETFERVTASFYKYFEIQSPSIFRDDLYKKFDRLKIFGRIYIAKEGINAQISIPENNLLKFKNHLKSEFNFEDLILKVAVEEGTSFYKLVVKIKNEIVAYNIPKEEYNMDKVGKHLDYKAFNQCIDDGAIVLDMRNYYEGEIGKFQNAIIPDIERSQDLLLEVKKILDNHKDDKILLYCTGGIRCEKASSYLIHHGFSDVNQLNGGIIQYANDIKKNNEKSKFIGKNFVFDNRMSESVTDDVIGECHICSKPSDLHTNCANEHCHILLIQCNKCKEELQNCCSKHCSDFILLPRIKRRELFKNGKIKFNAQKSDKIKPRLKEINNL